jgi:ATP-dependent Clp protease ATP-binding subunit ClpA
MLPMCFNDDWNPVNRIAQTESNKLAILPELIESKVIGQRSCFKIARSIQRNRAGLKIQTDQLAPLFFWAKQVLENAISPLLKII